MSVILSQNLMSQVFSSFWACDPEGSVCLTAPDVRVNYCFKGNTDLADPTPTLKYWLSRPHPDVEVAFPVMFLQWFFFSRTAQKFRQRKSGHEKTLSCFSSRDTFSTSYSVRFREGSKRCPPELIWSNTTSNACRSIHSNSLFIFTSDVPRIET